VGVEAVYLVDLVFAYPFAFYGGGGGVCGRRGGGCVCGRGGGFVDFFIWWCHAAGWSCGLGGVCAFYAGGDEYY